MLGYELSEIEPNVESWSSRVHPDDIENCFSDITAHMEGRTERYENVHRMQHKAGHWVYILDRGQVMERNEAGEVVRFTGTHTDVTELYRLQNELTETVEQLSATNENLQTHQAELTAQNAELSHAILQRNATELRLKSIFNVSPSAYVLIDHRGTILDHNERFNAMVERAPALVDGKPITVFLAESHSFFTHLRELRAGGYESNDVEWHRSEAKQLEHKRLPVRYGLTKIRIEGEDSQYLISLIDNTAEVNAEREHERLMETKSRFVANMSHEIRTPLHGVMGNLDLIKAIDHLPPESESAIETALVSGKHLARVVDDILDFSKLDAGAFQLLPKACDLIQVLEQGARLMEPLAQKRGLGFDLYLPESPVLAYVDETRLQQIVNNLVGNAIKFTSEGGVSLKAQWRAEPSDERGRLTLTIADSGIGIPSDQMDELFTPFIQGQLQRDKAYAGTGLGLSITQRLIELMDGSISVESEVNKGSRFTVTLTLNVASMSDVSETAGALEPSSATSDASSLEGLRVLIVDDSPVNRMLAVKMCNTLKVETLQAKDGLDAIEQYEQHATELDAILMDIQMPELDGIGATQRIRQSEKGRAVPIIAMTANVQREEQQEYEQAGMDGFLPKPFNVKALVDVLTATSSHRRGGFDDQEP